MSRTLAHAVDASVIRCSLFSESGAVRAAAGVGGAVTSTVNYAEILSKLIEHGVDPVEAVTRVDELPLALVPLDRDRDRAAARLRPATRTAGLSLGERCCLAPALRLGAVAVAADRAWGRLAPALGIAVDVVR